MQKLYLTQENAYHTFKTKTPQAQQLINEALEILEHFGIPIAGKTVRQLERTAMSFLALGAVNTTVHWEQAKSLADGYALKTRDVIEYVNEQFGESLSRGSYDDIRRKDLKHLILAGIVVSDKPQSARNNPNRAWAINPDYIDLIRGYGQDGWQDRVQQFMVGKPRLREQLMGKQREINKIPITLPSGVTLEFGVGKHNQLQRAIIEEFLPRYGYGAQVVYVGDAEDKFLHYDQEMADQLGLAPLGHAELPDVIAYSVEKNWLYLIEAVHTSGAMTAERVITLEPLVQHCKADVIYVTAFLDRGTFRRFVAGIAWETEVWIATSPDHLIHFNGGKFLNPY